MNNIIFEENEYTLININDIDKIEDNFTTEFLDFCKKNKIKLPKKTSNRYKSLITMINNKNKYWTRNECDEFINKFNIETKDSIQLFNKFSQLGIDTNSGYMKGKLFIIYPYRICNKYKMRKNFNKNISKEDLNDEINKIKSTINFDYINVSNDKWQLGHKNPGLEDNTINNLILQPPIQAKYKDEYIFFDTLTKLPLPNKLKRLLKNNVIELSEKQIKDYYKLFKSLLK